MSKPSKKLSIHSNCSEAAFNDLKKVINKIKGSDTNVFLTIRTEYKKKYNNEQNKEKHRMNSIGLIKCLRSTYKTTEPHEAYALDGKAYETTLEIITAPAIKKPKRPDYFGAMMGLLSVMIRLDILSVREVKILALGLGEKVRELTDKWEINERERVNREYREQSKHKNKHSENKVNR